MGETDSVQQVGMLKYPPLAPAATIPRTVAGARDGKLGRNIDGRDAPRLNTLESATDTIKMIRD